MRPAARCTQVPGVRERTHERRGPVVGANWPATASVGIEGWLPTRQPPRACRGLGRQAARLTGEGKSGPGHTAARCPLPATKVLAVAIAGAETAMQRRPLFDGVRSIAGERLAVRPWRQVPVQAWVVTGPLHAANQRDVLKQRSATVVLAKAPLTGHGRPPGPIGRGCPSTSVPRGADTRRRAVPNSRCGGQRAAGVDPAATCGHAAKNLQCPSDTTSAWPSTTLMAVWSSMAYAGPPIPAAHASAAAIVFSSQPG
jgi:hypothetical protein